MENVLDQLKEEIKIAFKELFNYECDIENISIDVTPKNFEGFPTQGPILKFEFISVKSFIFIELILSIVSKLLST